MGAWADHVKKWKDCTRCGLCQQRDRIVLARAGIAGGIKTGGPLPCDVLFIGEAPGASEDAIGLPFWGPAGDLMQKIIDRALPTGTTYSLSNLVACFPREAKARGENEPDRKEIIACRPRLLEFIGVARPKLIVRVGRLSSDYVEHDAHGKVCGVVVEDIIHPAAILKRDMPLAQKNMAVNKCIVTIRCAFRDVVESNVRASVTQGEPDASLKAKQERFQYPWIGDFDDPADDPTNDFDIPF